MGKRKVPEHQMLIQDCEFPCEGSALPLSYAPCWAHLCTKSPANPQLRRFWQQNAKIQPPRNRPAPPPIVPRLDTNRWWTPLFAAVAAMGAESSC